MLWNQLTGKLIQFVGTIMQKVTGGFEARFQGSLG